jgi:hypothetical protein
VIIDNKAGNGTFDYVDLLPTELWRIIIFHLGEGESARLARCCKKLNNYVSDIEIECKAKCRALHLGRSLTQLKLSFDWPLIYNSDTTPYGSSVQARFSWKNLYQSWKDYIRSIRSTSIQPATYCVGIKNNADDQRRFSTLKLPKDESKYIYLGTVGDYNNGTEIVIYQLGAEDSNKYYLGYSTRSDFNYYELYSYADKGFTSADLNQLLITGLTNLFSFADLHERTIIYTWNRQGDN